jgi:hypothetical protein
MARKSAAGPNKSAAIRAYKDSHASAGPKEITEALGKDGVKVTPAFVSTVLSNDRRKGRKGRGKGGRPRGSSSANAFADLVQAKKLADQMGGVEKARAALNALAKILGA